MDQEREARDLDRVQTPEEQAEGEMTVERIKSMIGNALIVLK